MQNLTLTKNKFDTNGYWCKSVPGVILFPDVFLFDQNGYDLTILEQRYAKYNNTFVSMHRDHRHALKKDWFKQSITTTGAVLNHSLLFERKAYSGDAKKQLIDMAGKNNLIYKILAIRPKWGLDFSMDYVDTEGNSFEILHWEYDGFNVDEVQSVKEKIEPVLAAIDWVDAGKQLLKRKDEWHHLEFFEQSDWKCKYFNVPKERFKMVIWE